MKTWNLKPWIGRSLSHRQYKIAQFYFSFYFASLWLRRWKGFNRNYAVSNVQGSRPNSTRNFYLCQFVLLFCLFFLHMGHGTGHIVLQTFYPPQTCVLGQWWNITKTNLPIIRSVVYYSKRGRCTQEVMFSS